MRTLKKTRLLVLVEEVFSKHKDEVIIWRCPTGSEDSICNVWFGLGVIDFGSFWESLFITSSGVFFLIVSGLQRPGQMNWSHRSPIHTVNSHRLLFDKSFAICMRSSDGKYTMYPHI